MKLFLNPHEDQRESIPYISRTMCKLAIISKDYSGLAQMPTEPSFFWVRIQQETFARGRPTSQSGVFVVEPLAPVKDNAIMRLLPGMFHTTATEGIVIIRPTQTVNLPWIIPLNLRKKLAKENCLTGDALIPTERGLLPLASLKQSGATRVLTRTGAARIKRWQKTGYKRTLTLATKSGQTLRLTPDHRVLILKADLTYKWRSAGRLRIGDQLVARNGSLVKPRARSLGAMAAIQLDELYDDVLERDKWCARTDFPQTLTVELARILGYLASEGSFGADHRLTSTGVGIITFSNTNRELVEDFVSCWHKCFGFSPTASNRDGKWTVQLNRVDVSAWFVSLGLVAGTASTKHVPACVLRGGSATVGAFLAAYFEGDGSLAGSGGRMNATSVSRQLLHEIKQLIASLGIRAVLRLGSPAGRRAGQINLPCWSLDLGPKASRALADKIGVVSSARRRALVHWTLLDNQRQRKYYDRQGVPYVRDFVRQVIARHSTGRGGGRQYWDHHGEAVAGPILYERRPDHLEITALSGAQQPDQKHVAFVAEQLEKLDPEMATRLRNLVGDWYFDPVVSITENPLLEAVYDISTSAGQFVANGLVVHNCAHAVIVDLTPLDEPAILGPPVEQV